VVTLVTLVAVVYQHVTSKGVVGLACEVMFDSQEGQGEDSGIWRTRSGGGCFQMVGQGEAECMCILSVRVDPVVLQSCRLVSGNREKK
jgi:hypothetical protein